MPEVEFTCLANSRKMGGRCIAGVTTSGAWVRPVGPNADGCLYPWHYVLADGSEAAVLDHLRVEVTAPRPGPYQPENWEVGARRWKRVRKLSGAEAKSLLRGIVLRSPEIFGNRGDRVAYADLVEHPIGASLCVVQPQELSWYITTAASGRRQTRANFRLGNVGYDLSVTDPIWESRLQNLGMGMHQIEESGLSPGADIYFTLSLGEPFQGSCYKLVAAVIVL